MNLYLIFSSWGNGATNLMEKAGLKASENSEWSKQKRRGRAALRNRSLLFTRSTGRTPGEQVLARERKVCYALHFLCNSRNCQHNAVRENHTTAIQEGIQHCIQNEWKHFERYIFAVSQVEHKPNKDHGHTYTFNQLTVCFY